MAVDLGGWNESLQWEYENIRQLCFEGILKADAKYRKLRMGQALWSRVL